MPTFEEFTFYLGKAGSGQVNKIYTMCSLVTNAPKEIKQRQTAGGLVEEQTDLQLPLWPSVHYPKRYKEIF